MPRRVLSPFQFAKPVIEPIVQPLYDRITFVAALANLQQRFFINVAGKTELDIHPDITGGGQLSHPKIFVIYGIRLAFDEDVAEDAKLPDLQNLVWNSWYRLHVGTKDYVTVPVFYLPAGIGITGSAAYDSMGVPTFTQIWQNGNNGFFNRFSIERRRIMIPPQQSFYGEYNVVGLAALNADRRVWNFLDGEFGREVM